MLTKLGAHDHAVLVYDARDQLLAGLAEFTHGCVRRGELAVFVHAFHSNDEARAFVASAPNDLSALVDRQLFLLSFYEEAFEGGRGRIDFDHVVKVVDDLLTLARKGGRSGLGVYVDASRVYLDGGRGDEWFAFEERLGRRLQHAMALVCAYPSASIRAPAVRERVLLTHQYRFEVA